VGTRLLRDTLPLIRPARGRPSFDKRLLRVICLGYFADVNLAVSAVVPYMLIDDVEVFGSIIVYGLLPYRISALLSLLITVGDCSPFRCHRSISMSSKYFKAM
jgi:hypothetical protein